MQPLPSKYVDIWMNQDDHISEALLYTEEFCHQQKKPWHLSSLHRPPVNHFSAQKSN